MERYNIIGLREQYPKELDKLLDDDCAEAKEINKGYSNPLIVANIIKCRIKCLEEKLGKTNG